MMSHSDLAKLVVIVAMTTIFFFPGSCLSEDPLEVVDYENIDACSAYVPKKRYRNILAEDAIKIVELNRSDSLKKCSNFASVWRRSDQPSDRCQTACWFHGQDHQGHCFCLVDMIWMPRVAAGDDPIDSARLVWPCQDDSNCSFNGSCNKTGRCQCSEGWKGLTCSELDLLPVNRKVLGYRQVDATGHNISSWGAPVLFDEESKRWHGYASEIQGYCGINAWETNSRIVHIVGDSPHGTFRRQETVWPAFAHEPSVVRGPRGEWVMLFSSYRYNATGLKAVICGNCKDGATPEISSQCPFQLGHPENLSHVFRQMLSIAESPNGPWSLPVEIPQLSQAWDWNTDFTIHKDGSAVALIRGGMTWHAANFSDPTTWHPVGSKHGKGSQGPDWTGVSAEDPFIWQSNGVYHALAHAFLPFYGVHAFAVIPKPDFNWDLPLNWTVTGVAYDNLVQFSDGSTHAYARRERPHLVLTQKGTPGALSNAVQYTGRLRQAYADGSYTLMQPIRSRKSDTAAHGNVVDE